MIREETPRDAKAEMSQHLPSFASLGAASRIIVSFGRNGIGT